MPSELKHPRGSLNPERSLTGGKFIAGLVGQGIQHSRTPAMHEAEAEAQGLRLIYQLIDTARLTEPAVSFPEILRAAEITGFTGLNVTYPFKKEAMIHMDDVSDSAKAIGAINTVILKNGRRTGHNTDYWGFSESFRQGLPGVDQDCVLLVGAGGAGGAVANALLDQGVKCLLIADTDERAVSELTERLKARSHARIDTVRDMQAAAKAANGIINATPIGMTSIPGCPIPTDLLETRHWVADVIYFPLETELLRAARTIGCQTLPGSGMAVFQAFRAFKLFTGLTPDYQRMKETFDAFIE